MRHGVVDHLARATPEQFASHGDVGDRRDREQHQSGLRALRRRSEQLARQELVQRVREESTRGEVDVAAHRRQAENGRPTLGRPHQTGTPGDRADSREDLGGFLVGHRELVDSDLEALAVYLEARREPVGPRSRRDQEPDLQALDEHRQELLGLVRSGRLPFVHDEEDVLAQRLERA